MESIDQQIRETNWQNPVEVKTFYEANSLYFNNYERIEDQEKISDFLDIKLNYANSLANDAHFDKISLILEQVKELLLKLDDDHPNKERSDRSLRFQTGMLLGNQKKFKESYPIFKQLAKEDPEHNYYKVWLDHTRFGLYSSFFNILLTIGTVLIFADLLFSLNEIFVLDPGFIGLVIVAVTFLFQQAAKEYFKSKKKATNKR